MTRTSPAATEVVTIAGAGPVGTLLALLLAARGRQVQVFERRADPRRSSPERGRSINLALAARGLKALERADALGRITPEMVMMKGRQLHASDGTQSFLPYGSRDSEVIYSISRARLNCALIEAAGDCENIQFYFDTRCTDFEPSSGRLLLQESGGASRAVSAPLLVAADGAGSALRGALAAAGHLAVREIPLAHDYKEFHIEARGGTWALQPHALHIWPRGGFMLIALPNTDGSFTATLFLSRTGPNSFAALTNANAAVHEFFKREFADAAALMPNLLTEFATHPQGQLGTVHLTPWHIGGSVLMLGDAAHAIVPFHGQGMNAAFEDCIVLDGLLDRHDTWETLFEDFAHNRRPNTTAIAEMALENYTEMRDTVLDAGFVRRKAIAMELERRFPDRFIPRYSMVMFHPEIPYAEAQRRGEVQAEILIELDSTRDPSGTTSAQLAERLVKERLAPIAPN